MQEGGGGGGFPQRRKDAAVAERGVGTMKEGRLKTDALRYLKTVSLFAAAGMRVK